MNHRFMPIAHSTAAKVALVALVGVALSTSALPASAVPETVHVTGAQIASDSAGGRAAGKWYVDNDFRTANGSYSVANDSPDSSMSLKLATPASTDGVRVMRQLDAGPNTDLPALLSGSSYTWAGPNVDFHAEVSFIPNNAADYGPTAPNTPCTRAVAGNDVLCWTVLKWDPNFAASAWHKTDLSADTASGDGSEGGWRNTKQVGIYTKPGVPAGNKLSEYLGQMQSYTVLSAGVSLGSGAAANAQAWVNNLTFGGKSYDFVAASTSSTVSVSPSGAALKGDAVTITGTVTPTAAVGTVEIFDGSTSLGSGAVVNGAFAVSSSTLVLGSHNFSATFTPTSAQNYQASKSASASFSVNERLAQPLAPPVTSTTELVTLINSGTIPDVTATTNSFVPSAETTGNKLDNLDVSKPFSGSLPWVNTQDSFVDVYAYSSPVFVGTFPVIGGQVQMSGINLSALQAGGHYLVFQGQTSGTVSVMAITVAIHLPIVNG